MTQAGLHPRAQATSTRPERLRREATSESQGSSSHLRRFGALWVTGGIAGFVGGLVEATCVQLFGVGVQPDVAPVIRLVLAMSLLGVTTGLVAGIAVAAAATPSKWTWRNITSPTLAAIGVASPLVVAASFHQFLWITSHLRNPALAALASAGATVVILALSLMFGRSVAAGTRALGARFLGFKRPERVLVGVLVFWITLALPGFVRGPDVATRGAFGFVGLLRMDTLDYRPWLSVLAFAIAFLVASRFTRSLSESICLLAGVTLFGVSMLGAAMTSADDIRPVVLERGTLSRAPFMALQWLGDSDGDGFSRWLGGGDCDDDNAARHPGARELPDNGIDEDCDGDDLQSSTTPAVAPPVRTSPPTSSALSFLIITVDALRPDLGFMGYERNTSPNIDAFARQSTVFEHAYAISTYTGFCLPPMMAGRYPSEMPRDNRHEVHYGPANVFLAERLHAAGFHTAGAASHFLFSPELGWVDGFERFLKAPLEGSPPPGSHVDLYHSSRGLTESTISLLRRDDITGGRFFLWVHFLDPHKQYLEHPGYSTFGATARDLYDGEIAYTDAHIGQLLQELDASPLAARTVVILTGDHGEAFGEHGEYFHGGEIWDEVLHVPLVIRAPGTGGSRVSTRVSHVDIFPTVLELAGLPADDHARGQSLVPALSGDPLPARPILIDQPKSPYYRPKHGFIEGDFKLHHLIDVNAYRLFNLRDDPGETHDLAPDHREDLERVRLSYIRTVANIPEVQPSAP